MPACRASNASRAARRCSRAGATIRPSPGLRASRTVYWQMRRLADGASSSPTRAWGQQPWFTSELSSGATSAHIGEPSGAGDASANRRRSRPCCAGSHRIGDESRRRRACPEPRFRAGAQRPCRRSAPASKVRVRAKPPTSCARRGRSRNSRKSPKFRTAAPTRQPRQITACGEVVVGSRTSGSPDLPDSVTRASVQDRRGFVVGLPIARPARGSASSCFCAASCDRMQQHRRRTRLADRVK